MQIIKGLKASKNMMFMGKEEIIVTHANLHLNLMYFEKVAPQQIVQ